MTATTYVAGPGGHLVPRITEREDRLDALLWELVELEAKQHLNGLTDSEADRYRRFGETVVQWARIRVQPEAPP